MIGARSTASLRSSLVVRASRTCLDESVAVDEFAHKHVSVCIADDQLAGVAVGGAQVSDPSCVIEGLTGNPFVPTGQRNLPFAARIPIDSDNK